MKTRAAVLYASDKPLKIETLDIPKLKTGQVLVKVFFSGLCHSQLNEIRGKRGIDLYLPHLLGHEGAGVIQRCGPLVTKVKTGDFVVLTWIKGMGKEGGSTRYTRKGQRIHAGPITTLSQYAMISENRVVSVSRKLPQKIAALLGCAVPTGAGIIRHEVGLRKGDSIAIFGIGGIGAAALMYAQRNNPSHLIAVDVVVSKLRFAKQIGATHVIHAGKEDVQARIEEITGRRGLDYAVECSGSASAMETAFQAIHGRGVTVIAGNLAKGKTIAIDPFDLIRGKKIIGTWGGRTNPDRDIPLYARKYFKNELQLDRLITRVYPLRRVNRAIADLEEGKTIRALIDCQEG